MMIRRIMRRFANKVFDKTHPLEMGEFKSLNDAGHQQ